MTNDRPNALVGRSGEAKAVAFKQRTTASSASSHRQLAGNPVGDAAGDSRAGACFTTVAVVVLGSDMADPAAAGSADRGGQGWSAAVWRLVANIGMHSSKSCCADHQDPPIARIGDARGAGKPTCDSRLARADAYGSKPGWP
jgi:hypothetical protein